MSHECPAPGCPARVPDHMLACRRDWYRLPGGLRSRVWAAWANGTGARSPEHTEVLAEADAWYRAHA